MNRILRSLRLPLAGAILLALLPSAAGGRDDRPNILLVIWNSVRADRMSLYGYSKKTTPFLEKWSKEARIYDECLSVSNQTPSSIASLFTGLLPGEHGVKSGAPRLDDSVETLAEILGEAGYETCLYSATPRISSETNFTQGFQKVEHPWSNRQKGQVIRLMKRNIYPADQGTELPDMIREGDFRPENLKSTGAVAFTVLKRWIRERAKSKPFFIVLDYMEAQSPRIPSPASRRRVMSGDQVDRSWKIDGTREFTWMYNAGLDEMDPENLEIAGGIYDATLTEMDEFLRNVIGLLGRIGYVENKPDVSTNTAILLTSDHGEHLGERHLLDHQYSLYQPLLRVPLVLRYEPLFPAGRDSRPAQNFDLFPTILDLARIEAPGRSDFGPVSLLDPPAENRTRIAECLGLHTPPLEMLAAMRPSWDQSPWRRELRALVEGNHKLIRASDGSGELYDLGPDPMEERNLYRPGDPLSDRLDSILDGYGSFLSSPPGPGR